MLYNLYSAQTLITHVDNFRASRGDVSGTDQVKSIAVKLGLQNWGIVLSALGCGRELVGVVEDAKQLLSLLDKWNKSKSEEEKADWMRQNYNDALKATASLLWRLFKLYNFSGPLGKAVEIARKGVVEGNFLRGCLTSTGINDLKGLVQIIIAVAPENCSISDKSRDEL